MHAILATPSIPSAIPSTNEISCTGIALVYLYDGSYVSGSLYADSLCVAVPLGVKADFKINYINESLTVGSGYPSTDTISVDGDRVTITSPPQFGRKHVIYKLV